MQIILDLLPIEVLRKSIKHMYLRVSAIDGAVKVTAPLHVSINEIEHFVRLKKSWILRSHERIIQKKLSEKPLVNENVQYYLGEAYQLKMHFNAQSARIEIEQNVMHCFLLEEYNAVQKEYLLQVWYKQQMQDILPKLIEKWEVKVGVKTHGYRIKSMKSRWGSCQIVSKIICLNLSLIKKPLQCLEYVVVHELVHLLEANHSQRFYKLMDKFMPEWKQYKALLDSCVK